MLVDKDATLFLSGLLPEFLVRALAGSVPEFRILRLWLSYLHPFCRWNAKDSLMTINILLLAFFLAVQTTVKGIAGAVTCCSRSALCV